MNEKNVVTPLSEGVKDVNIAERVRSSFLDYAMSVIVARALPDVRDGLKPVHRRIIYAMSDLGMTHTKPYKKSARIVGDVIGKYHPHGDSSVYDALVRLAQDFSSRYPLIDGHGNFGSIDGDPAAAMRYTEARMARIASEMVVDINKDTVDFADNYDGEEQEPVVLPARYPNLLANGASGIAVGMATNIPPHNLSELVDGLLALIENENIEVLELMEHILAPDFPTGGILLGKSGIKKAYLTGNGSFIIRSRVNIEEKDNRKKIIVTQIPYAVNKTNLVKKIADLVKDKVIEGITDLRDESNREGIRIVIDLRRDIIPEVMVNQLYKLTPLQVTFSINLLALSKGQPKVMNLKEVLQEYLTHQIDVIRRRSKFELNKTIEREHIVEGLIICQENVDEVIEIIKSSDDGEDAGNKLKERFNLSDKQVKVILDMPLRRITKLERDKIFEELNSLKNEIIRLKAIIESDQLIKEIIVADLNDIRARYGDVRRSEISDSDAEIEDEDLIPEEDVIISITQNGYIKRMALDTYRVQNRGGKGIKGISTYQDDIVDKLLVCSTHSDVMFFSDKGKVYRLRGHRIPEFSRQAKGIPVINLLQLEKDENIITMLNIKEYSDNAYILFVSKLGIAKRVSLSHFISINRNGKKAFTVRENDSLFDVKLIGDDSIVMIASSGGKVVKLNSSQEFRTMGRLAAGNRAIRLDSGQKVVGVATSDEGDLIFSITEKGYGKSSPIDSYRETRRGAKGVKTLNATERVGQLVCLKAFKGDEQIFMTTNKGIVIRILASQVKVLGRATQGVKMIRLDEDQSIASVAIFKNIEEEEEVQTPLEIDENDLLDEVIDDEQDEEINEDLDEVLEEIEEDDE